MHMISSEFCIENGWFELPHDPNHSTVEMGFCEVGVFV